MQDFECIKYIVYHIPGMDSCEVEPDECDFFQEYMDLEEFINVSTTGVISPQSPFGTDTSTSCLILDGHKELETATSVNEQHELQRQQIVNNSVMAVQEMPNLNDLGQTELASSTAENRPTDQQNAADAPDSKFSVENSVTKDKRYWDRRLKNNIAAKRSRDAKRMKETTVVKRWSLLEEENKRLKEQISNMKKRLNAATGGCYVVE